MILSKNMGLKYIVPAFGIAIVQFRVLFGDKRRFDKSDRMVVFISRAGKRQAHRPVLSMDKFHDPLRLYFFILILKNKLPGVFPKSFSFLQAHIQELF